MSLRHPVQNKWKALGDYRCIYPFLRLIFCVSFSASQNVLTHTATLEVLLTQTTPSVLDRPRLREANCVAGENSAGWGEEMRQIHNLT